jgi:NDP-sugar pyrophosphorylase family protein
MKAVILAGGKGTRLAPFTTVLPKPLLPLGEVPIVEIILRQLRRHGITHVTMACGHLGELIRTYLDNNRISSQLQIDYYCEDEPLGTAGALAGIGSLDGAFLVMNGDILTTLDYSQLLQFHAATNPALTIAVTSKKVQIELGILQIDRRDRVIGYIEKPVETFPASTGIYVYGPRALDFIEPDTYLDFPTLVLRLIEAGEPVVAYRTDAFWLDMGNKGDYDKAVKAFCENPSMFGVERLPEALRIGTLPRDPSRTTTPATFKR